MGGDRIGSVADLHLEGAPHVSFEAIAGLRKLLLGEAPQVAAARTDHRPPGGGVGGLWSRARGRLPDPCERVVLLGSLGASPEGPHCGTLKSVYIGQRRLFFVLKKENKKRGMLARQYRRSSENGDYWRLELIMLGSTNRAAV